MSVNYLTSVCVLSLGARVHGYDEPTDDHSSADATDPVPPSAPGPAAATAGSNATAGKHTHTHTHTKVGPSPRPACLDMSVLGGADTH